MDLAGTRLHQQVLVGSPATVILEQAAVLRADLIVLGTPPASTIVCSLCRSARLVLRRSRGGV